MNEGTAERIASALERLADVAEERWDLEAPKECHKVRKPVHPDWQAARGRTVSRILNRLLARYGGE